LAKSSYGCSSLQRHHKIEKKKKKKTICPTGWVVKIFYKSDDQRSA
jgi:hypothetical protein